MFSSPAFSLRFSMAYLLDLVLKLAATPLDVYPDDVKNRFDLCVTPASSSSSVYWASPPAGITADMLHYFTTLRLLRLLRCSAGCARSA